MKLETVDYGVRCSNCGSPIRIGHVQRAERVAEFTLNPTEIKCGNCHASAVYRGEATVFPRTNVYAYWGVKCTCGNFHPLKRADIDPLQPVPDVGKFKTICRHVENSALVELIWKQDDLIKVEMDKEIKNFQPHPLFR